VQRRGTKVLLASSRSPGRFASDVEPYEAALAEDREEVDKAKVTFWISAAVRMVLALIAAAYLVNVLWLQRPGG
jgi:hypothetical protein